MPPFDKNFNTSVKQVLNELVDHTQTQGLITGDEQMQSIIDEYGFQKIKNRELAPDVIAVGTLVKKMRDRAFF